jgi:hypothetical protein
MPYQSNIERNVIIYQHWQEGKTIEEISTLTGIPHSTVGYASPHLTTSQNW